MRKINLLACLAIVLSGTTLMNAQATRTWVSGVGDDANPCSRTAPCKTFAGAISKTAPSGEIDALDPGGFGALTITKAITLDGGGGQVASILVAGTNGIVVAAGVNDVVIIRNMRFDGLFGGGNAGINGISWISGKALHIEKCDIFNFGTNGINIAKSDGGNLFITDTTVQNNGGSGVRSANTTANMNATIVNSKFEGNGFTGVFAGEFSNFSVSNSDASGNTGFGYVAQSTATSATMNIYHSTAANNGVGMQAGGNAGTSTINIENVALFNNAAGMVSAAGGTIKSWGNNYNTGTGAPALPNLNQQ